MKVDLYNFVSALNCVAAQRLVRLACLSCKKPVRYTRTELVESGIDPSMADRELFEGRGCIDCNGTGYHGREAIVELLDMSDRIRQLILDRRPAHEIRLAAREEGMHSLRESAVEKLLTGKTTLREINKVTFVD
jgi:type IV pilus assembly protein PilB